MLQALSKLGLKPIAGVSRVTIRKSKNILFVVKSPEVLKSPNSDTFIVFGEATIDDLSSSRLNAAAEKMASEAAVQPPAAEGAVEAEAPAASDVKESDEPLDESGLEAKDIELVMSQAGVSRAAAVGALKKSNGDIVNAIMVGHFHFSLVSCNIELGIDHVNWYP